MIAESIMAAIERSGVAATYTRVSANPPPAGSHEIRCTRRTYSPREIAPPIQAGQIESIIPVLALPDGMTPAQGDRLTMEQRAWTIQDRPVPVIAAGGETVAWRVRLGAG